jgi:hypothetical protein
MTADREGRPGRPDPAGMTSVLVPWVLVAIVMVAACPPLRAALASAVRGILAGPEDCGPAAAPGLPDLPAPVLSELLAEAGGITREAAG